MKISREKRYRQKYVQNKLEQVVKSITKSLGLEEAKSQVEKESPRNVCQITGRSRTVIKGYRQSRHIFRRETDSGYHEGVRRGTW